MHNRLSKGANNLTHPPTHEQAASGQEGAIVNNQIYHIWLVIEDLSKELSKDQEWQSSCCDVNNAKTGRGKDREVRVLLKHHLLSLFYESDSDEITIRLLTKNRLELLIGITYQYYYLPRTIRKRWKSTKELFEVLVANSKSIDILTNGLLIFEVGTQPTGE